MNEVKFRKSISPEDSRVPDDILQINGRDMETPYRKDCSQGLEHVHKDLVSFQMWAYKHKY
jgi:hypothetical protein